MQSNAWHIIPYLTSLQAVQSVTLGFGHHSKKQFRNTNQMLASIAVLGQMMAKYLLWDLQADVCPCATKYVLLHDLINLGL